MSRLRLMYLYLIRHGNIFSRALVLPVLVNKGLGEIWRYIQVYLLCIHCLASLDLVWAERGMGA